MSPTERLAEVWATIDGKHLEFWAEKYGAVKFGQHEFTGHYLGYMAEAEEMEERLRSRGIKLVEAKQKPWFREFWLPYLWGGLIAMIPSWSGKVYPYWLDAICWIVGVGSLVGIETAIYYSWLFYKSRKVAT